MVPRLLGCGSARRNAGKTQIGIRRPEGLVSEVDNAGSRDYNEVVAIDPAIIHRRVPRNEGKHDLPSRLRGKD